MPAVAAYCETPLQIRIAKAIAEASGSPDRFTVVIGDWSEEVGQRHAAAGSGLALETLRANDASPALTARWRAVREAVAAFLSAAPRRLLMFQDQHFFAQAVAAGARGAGAPYDLVQDGYLDFDMSRIPALKRALWPAVRAMDRSGPQQPSTRIRPFTNEQIYLSHFFGHTRPDRIFVFGRSLATRLQRQFGLSQDRVIVSGPALAFHTPPDAPRPLQRPDAMRVLFFDQCFLRYRRMRKAGWRRDYLPVIETLSDFGADVKLHPAQTDNCARDILNAMGGKGVLLGREPVGGEHIDHIDIAVTATSSSFLSCLERGTPVIFTDLPSSFDRMPTINSPLLRNVASPAELRQALISRRDGRFAANPKGPPLSEFVDFEAGGAALIAQRLTGR